MASCEAVRLIPGPAGTNGADGADGTDGSDAFSVTTASFTMPASSAAVSVTVDDNSWFSPTSNSVNGQTVHVQGAGYFWVSNKSGSTTVELTNHGYSVNKAAGSVIPTNARISPAGLKGDAGADGSSGAPTDATYWVRTSNGTLSAESDMSALATGYVKVTTGTGAPSSQAVPIPIADGGTNGITATAAFNNLSPVTTRGDIIIRDATNNVRLAIGAANRVLRSDGTDPSWAQVVLSTDVTGTLPVANGGTGGATAADARTNLGIARTLQDYLLYQHQLATGNSAGDFTSGSWVTVPLNTEVADTGGHGSIAANTVTLATGTYRVRWRVCGYQVANFQSRMWNVTNAALVAYGSNATSAAADGVTAYSFGEARITISAATEDIRLEAQCQTTNPGDGFGAANSFGGTEVYASLELHKEVG